MTVTGLAQTSLLLRTAVMRGIQASQQGGLRPVGRKAYCRQSLIVTRRMSMDSKSFVNDLFVKREKSVGGFRSIVDMWGRKEKEKERERK